MLARKRFKKRFQECREIMTLARYIPKKDVVATIDGAPKCSWFIVIDEGFPFALANKLVYLPFFFIVECTVRSLRRGRLLDLRLARDLASENKSKKSVRKESVTEGEGVQVRF